MVKDVVTEVPPEGIVPVFNTWVPSVEKLGLEDQSIWYWPCSNMERPEMESVTCVPFVPDVGVKLTPVQSPPLQPPASTGTGRMVNAATSTIKNTVVKHIDLILLYIFLF